VLRFRPILDQFRGQGNAEGEEETLLCGVKPCRAKKTAAFFNHGAGPRGEAMGEGAVASKGEFVRGLKGTRGN